MSDGRRTGAALAGIVLGAAMLRVWGLGYGLPHTLARPDEERIVGKALEISLGRISDPGPFPYPHLVYYTNSLALTAWREIGVAVGAYADTDDFLLDLKLRHPGLQYRICRAMGALFGTGTVLATFAAAFHGYRRRNVAILAALLVAVNHLHVRDSHYGTVDVPMTFFVTLALAFALRAGGTRSLRDALLSALFAGLAASAKYNAAIVILALVVAVGQRLRSSSDPGRWRQALTTLSLAAVVMCAAFAATSPHFVMNWREALHGLLRERHALFGGAGTPAWKIHLATTFPGAFGWPGFLVGTFGLVRALSKRRLSDLMLLAFVVPAFASIAQITWVVSRYGLPFVPPLAILAAETTLSLVPPRRLTLLGLVILALALPPLVNSATYDRLAAREDTRVQAANWVASNLPPRSRIAVCRGYGAPAVNDDHRRPPAFKPQEVPCTVEGIRGSHAPYVIVHDHPQVRFFYPSDAALRWLGANARPVAVFDPFRKDTARRAFFYEGDAFYIPYAGLGAVERGGPIVTIWRLGENGG